MAKRSPGNAELLIALQHVLSPDFNGGIIVAPGAKKNTYVVRSTSGIGVWSKTAHGWIFADSDIATSLNTQLTLREVIDWLKARRIIPIEPNKE